LDAHTGARRRTLEELRALPWTRELIPDGGGFFVRIQELDGCMSEGPTATDALANLDDALDCWLEVAIEQGIPIPRPRAEIEEFSGRFSVRVPRMLHRALVTLAERERVSLNQLVTSLLTSGVSHGLANSERIAGPAGRDVAMSGDAHEDIAADAVRSDSQGVGALKGIATWLRNRGDINLAVVLYALAGERSASLTGDSQIAASDFGAAGALARRHRSVRLAEELWRQSLLRDPTNIRSRSNLGQLLQHQGRFAEAIDHLEPAADVDNYAQLSLGWSLLYHGLDVEDEAETARGLSRLVTALRRWCAYANRSQLPSWLRHLARLEAMGPQYAGEVDQLLSFANSNANWGRVDRGHLRSQLPIDENAEEADEQAALDASSRLPATR
jgi:antitoxin HicB